MIERKARSSSPKPDHSGVLRDRQGVAIAAAVCKGSIAVEGLTPRITTNDTTAVNELRSWIHGRSRCRAISDAAVKVQASAGGSAQEIEAGNDSHGDASVVCLSIRMS